MEKAAFVAPGVGRLNGVYEICFFDYLVGQYNRISMNSTGPFPHKSVGFIFTTYI